MTGPSHDSSGEALRLAVASHYSDDARDRWFERARVGSIDWLALVNSASAHGLAPLVYAATAGLPASSAPSERLTELKRAYQHTMAQNMLAGRDLQTILRCLAGAGLQVALLKGAALLATVYDDPACRPMFDLDLLICHADLGLALAALDRVGYKAVGPEPFANLDGLYWNEVMLRGPGPTAPQLELHWDLLGIPYYASRLPAALLLDRARPVTVGDVQACCLAPEDLLLHVCAHNLFHHQGSLWRADVDIAFLVQRHGSLLDWDGLIDSAVALDLLLGLQGSLTRAARLWFAPIPAPILEAVKSLKPKTREHAMVACQRSEFLKLVRTFVTLPTLNHRVQFVKGQLFPSRDYLSWRYGVSRAIPGPLAYTKRYWSGLRGLFSELFGRSRAG